MTIAIGCSLSLDIIDCDKTMLIVYRQDCRVVVRYRVTPEGLKKLSNQVREVCKRNPKFKKVYEVLPSSPS